VYPHFLISRAPELQIPELARRVNDGQVGVAVGELQRELGSLEGVSVLVLGLTYREGVKELAYTRAMPLIERLRFHGAVVAAYDPLLSEAEVTRLGVTPWAWGSSSPARAVILQTADPHFRDLDLAWLPDLAVIYDGRNVLRGMPAHPGVTYLGVGVSPVRAEDGAARGVSLAGRAAPR